MNLVLLIRKNKIIKKPIKDWTDPVHAINNKVNLNLLPPNFYKNKHNDELIQLVYYS
jgi:hypothetical protein